MNMCCGMAVLGAGVWLAAGIGVVHAQADAGSDAGLSWRDGDTIRFQTACTVEGLFIRVAEDLVPSLRDGGVGIEKLGGSDGADPDWLRVRMTAEDSGGNMVGSLDFYLADFRFDDAGRDYLVADSTWIDLSVLGRRVKTLRFKTQASRPGPWTTNMWACLDIDDLRITPDPAVIESTFDETPPAPGGYWNGSDLSGGRISGHGYFRNDYDETWGSWSGFSCSRVNAPTTPGYDNQYAVSSPGTDVGGAGGYAVVYDSSWAEADVVTWRTVSEVQGFYVNNTAYAALAMRDGYFFAKKFGGADGNDADWFKLTITGHDADGLETGHVDFYLADYRFDDPARDYIVNTWTWVDLTPLGPRVKSLHFSLSSSDQGAWGMNTPAYFAMDGVKVIPAWGIDTVDYEDLGLSAGCFDNGSDRDGGFTSRGVRFANRYDSSWGSWAGFALSRVNDPRTPGWENQYAVYTPGSGHGGGGTYAVVYDDPWGEESDIVSFSGDHRVDGFYVNNTAYAALAMKDGGLFTRRFGGSSGNDPDWFKLSVTGKDRDGQVTGTVDFYLADYRFDDPARDYIVNAWTWVDLSALGDRVRTLHFSLSSSDTGAWGMNTPAYFAMDDLQIERTGPYAEDFIRHIAAVADDGMARWRSILASLLRRDGSYTLAADPAGTLTPSQAAALSKTIERWQAESESNDLFRWVRFDLPAGAVATNRPVAMAHLPDGRGVVAGPSGIFRQNTWKSGAWTRLAAPGGTSEPTFLAISSNGVGVVGYTGGTSNGVYVFDPNGVAPVDVQRIATLANPYHGIFRDSETLLLGTWDGGTASIRQWTLGGTPGSTVMTWTATSPGGFDGDGQGQLLVASGNDGMVTRFTTGQLATAIASGVPLEWSAGAHVYNFGSAGAVRRLAIDAFGRIWTGGEASSGPGFYCPVLNQATNWVTETAANAFCTPRTFTRRGRNYTAYIAVQPGPSGPMATYGRDLAAFFMLYKEARPFAPAQGGSDSAYDRGIPGFVGPDGEGAARIDNGDGTFQNPDNVRNPAFVAWASGWRDYAPADDVWSGDWNQPSKALGPVSGLEFDVVSLGELDADEMNADHPAGTITFTFDVTIADADGPDFAVFENAFSDGANGAFAELGYVEVSSDGVAFARFPSVSLVDQAVGWYAPVPAGALYNLCGKHVNGFGVSWGTPFDLDDLAGHPLVKLGLVDLDQIRYVRIVDIPGNGHFQDASSPAHAIYDSWPTEGSGGMDLEAIGVIHFRLECEWTETDAGRAISWCAVTNRLYQVQWTDHPSSNDWQALGNPIVGDGELHQVIDPDAEHRLRFYRVLGSLPLN